LVADASMIARSYDNALAETINGLFKAVVIHRREPWRSFEAIEYAPRVCRRLIVLGQAAKAWSPTRA
jgi:hypothetical protein